MEAIRLQYGSNKNAYDAKGGGEHREKVLTVKCQNSNKCDVMECQTYSIYITNKLSSR